MLQRHVACENFDENGYEYRIEVQGKGRRRLSSSEKDETFF